MSYWLLKCCWFFLIVDGDINFGQDLYACVRRSFTEWTVLMRRCLGGMEAVERMVQQRLVSSSLVKYIYSFPRHTVNMDMGIYGYQITLRVIIRLDPRFPFLSKSHMWTNFHEKCLRCFT